MKNKNAFYALRVLSFFVSIVVPCSAVIEKFPIWINTQGVGRTAGASLCMLSVIVCVTFKSTIFSALQELNWFKHAPPIMWAIGFTTISVILSEIGKIIQDFKIIGFSWIVGCLISLLINFIADKKFGKKEDT